MAQVVSDEERFSSDYHVVINSQDSNVIFQKRDMSVNDFVLFVDRNVCSDLGLGLLKLSLYAELGWAKLDGCSRPSDVFTCLKETSQSEETALKIFLFALEAIGGKVRGRFCVNEAKNRLKQSKLPEQLDFASQSREFHFFHCLVKIARKVPPIVATKMIQHFSRDPRILSHHSIIQNLPELFIYLYQRQIITERDTGDLEAELRRRMEYYSDPEGAECNNLNKCLSCLNNFHTTDMTVPFTSSDALSTAPSLEGSLSVQHQHSTKCKGNQQIPLQTVLTNPSTSKDLMSRVEQQPSTMQGDTQTSRKRWLGVLVIGVFILCALVVVTVPCSLSVWRPLHQHSTLTSTQQLHGNAVILGEMNSFFVKEVKVQENVWSRESAHKIDVYMTQQGCNDVPTFITVDDYIGSQFMNTTPTYMVAGSKIDIYACVGTSDDVESHIELYIVSQVDDTDFDPYEVISTTIEVGAKGEMKCSNITKEIQNSDYYYLVFLLPSKPLNVSCEIHKEIVSIDVKALNTSYIGFVWYKDDSVSINLPHWRETYCLLGDVQSYEVMRPFVHTEVRLSLNYSKTLGLTLGLGIPLLILWTIGVTMAVLIRLHFKAINQMIIENEGCSDVNENEECTKSEV